MDEDELFVFAKQIQAPFSLVQASQRRCEKCFAVTACCGRVLIPFCLYIVSRSWLIFAVSECEMCFLLVCMAQRWSARPSTLERHVRELNVGHAGH